MLRSKTFAFIALCTMALPVVALSQQRMVPVPAGTPILVRTVEPVDSNVNPQGYRFATVLETNLTVGGNVVVPAGNTAFGQLAQAKQAGRATGSSELALELTSIVINGTAYPVITSDYEVKGKSSGKRSAKRLLGGAGLGAIIGGIAGNAGMGAAIGATAGAVGSVAQKGQAVQVPSETLIQFTLEQTAYLPVP